MVGRSRAGSPKGFLFWRSFCADGCGSIPIPYRGIPLSGGDSERGFLIQINDFLKDSLPQSSSKGVSLPEGASERGFLVKTYDFLKESLPQSSSKGIPLPGGASVQMDVDLHPSLIEGFLSLEELQRDDSLFKYMISLRNPCLRAPPKGFLSLEELLRRWMWIYTNAL